MSKHGRTARRVFAVVVGFSILAAGSPAPAAAVGGERLVTARIVAVGVPDASAISAIGTFLPGGPIHDNPTFAAYTRSGRILDPVRVLVASRSNFGAPVARPDWEKGALLSIDPRGEGWLTVAPRFAASGATTATERTATMLRSLPSRDRCWSRTPALASTGLSDVRRRGGSA